MQKKFISNLILLALLNLVIKPVAIFGIDATVQNRVGSADYGLYFSLLNFTYLFNILLDFGINNFTTKNVAQYPGLMTKYIGKIAGLRIVLFLIYAFFTFGIALVLDYSANVYPILGILVLQQFFVGMIAYFRSYLSGMLLFKLDAFLSVLDRFLLIVLCGSMLYLTQFTNTFKIDYFIWIQFACYFISFIVGMILVMKYAGKIKVRIHKPISLLIARQSFPYALLIVLMALFTRVDSVMLERMLIDGARQTGIYAQGFRLLDAFFMFAMLFSNLLFPIFSKMIAAKEHTKPLFTVSSKLLIWGAIGLVSFCFWNANELLDLIYENDISETVLPFQLLMLTFVAMSTTLIYGTYLTALGEMKTLNIIAFIGLIVNICLNFYWIPKYGVNGAAMATLITQFAVAISEVFVVTNRLKLSVTIKNTLTFFLFIGVTFFGTWILKEYGTFLVLQIAFVLLCLILFKVINIRLFKSILFKPENN